MFYIKIKGKNPVLNSGKLNLQSTTITPPPQKKKGSGGCLEPQEPPPPPPLGVAVIGVGILVWNSSVSVQGGVVLTRVSAVHYRV